MLVSLSQGVMAQWDLVYSDTTDWGYRDIHFVSQDTGFITGSGSSIGEGFLLRTFDGGSSWDTLTFGVDALRGIDFPTPDTGYITGFDAFQLLVLKTVDKGVTWSIISDSIEVGSPLYLPVEFLDSEHGFMTSGGWTWITNDGGLNWDTLSTSFGSNYAEIDNGVCYIGWGFGYQHSSDQFQTSTHDSLFHDTGGDVSVKNDLVLCDGSGSQGGSFGYPNFNFGILATRRISTGEGVVNHFPDIYAIAGVERTNNACYAATWSYTGTLQIIKSIDDGQTWYNQASSESGGFSVNVMETIHCVNDSTCYACGEGNIYKTTNGGGGLLTQTGLIHVGVEEPEPIDLKIFPNPSTGHYTVRLAKDFVKFDLKVLDFNGKEVYAEADLYGNCRLDLSGFSDGMYFIQLTFGGNVVSRKIIKQ